MSVDVYLIGGGAFQVDCSSGESFVFAPSRLCRGHVECIEVHPPSAKARAYDALVSAIVAVMS